MFAYGEQVNSRQTEKDLSEEIKNNNKKKTGIWSYLTVNQSMDYDISFPFFIFFSAVLKSYAICLAFLSEVQCFSPIILSCRFIS